MKHVRMGTFALTIAGLCAGGGCSTGDVERAPARELTGTTQQAVVQTFAAGSLVIPMDTTRQDNGMFRAYGLVYALLRANVPVRWAINPAKVQDGVDFTIAAPATVVNRESAANVATPIAYRGGPFIIDSADRTAALPVITAWLAADAVTVVHDVTAGTFQADIERTLTAAPSLAVFEDGNQAIAYANLNAAGILDAAGNTWTGTSPGSLANTEVVATAGNNADGALFATGTPYPAFCHLSSEHYVAPTDPEVVAEVRSWLDAGPWTHGFMQCVAATAFENTAAAGGNPGGRFLTTLGVTEVGGPPNPITNRVPADPLTQYDGAIVADSGTTDSVSLTTGAFRTGVRTLINETGQALTDQIMLLTGNLDGNAQKGKVTLLTGHDYSFATPVSTNALTNGLRIYFNGIFASPCALAVNQPTVTLTKAAPALTNGSNVTFTLTYANTSTTTPAFGAVLTDTVPAGTTFVSATGGGTEAGGTVTWTLGMLAPGATANVSFTVSVAADATIPNAATLTYRAWQTPRSVTSNSTSTVRDATAPDTTIVSGPPASGTSNSAPFDFSSNEPAATFECSLDGAPFAPCTDPMTFSGVAAGPHKLLVRARDAAGNVDATPAEYDWTVTTGGDVDSDGDGLSDNVEKQIGTNPNDADTDDDGVPDGFEPSFDKDTDGDGLINALDPDSDNDGLFDGTEMGRGCNAPGTDASKRHCIPDGDSGATTTNPLDKDTDRGGASDGSEDSNLNGVLDPGEKDPTVGHGADDKDVVDSDGDGLSDGLEVTLGSNPNDADSDDDGLVDGDEPNPNDDTDGDGVRNILDRDSDGDGIFDGTEMGRDCANPATNAAAGSCIADADLGATKTSPLDPDTDHGGIRDGDEDTNKNGVVDPGEKDPNDPRDDVPAKSLEGGGLACAASTARGTPSPWRFDMVALFAIAAIAVRRARRSFRNESEHA